MPNNKSQHIAKVENFESTNISRLLTNDFLFVSCLIKSSLARLAPFRKIKGNGIFMFTSGLSNRSLWINMLPVSIFLEQKAKFILHSMS